MFDFELHPQIITDCFLMSKPSFGEFYTEQFGIEIKWAYVMWDGVRENSDFFKFKPDGSPSHTIARYEPELWVKLKAEMVGDKTTLAQISQKEEKGNQLDYIFSSPEFKMKGKKIEALIKLGLSSKEIWKILQEHNIVVNRNYLNKLIHKTS
jgi:hypothetical protein